MIRFLSSKVNDGKELDKFLSIIFLRYPKTKERIKYKGNEIKYKKNSGRTDNG